MPIMEQQQLSWVPYFSTVVKATAAENVIASVFCPSDLRSGDDAIQCKLDSSSATPSLSYTVGGKTTTFAFSADKITREEK